MQVNCWPLSLSLSLAIIWYSGCCSIVIACANKGWNVITRAGLGEDFTRRTTHTHTRVWRIRGRRSRTLGTRVVISWLLQEIVISARRVNVCVFANCLLLRRHSNSLRGRLIGNLTRRVQIEADALVHLQLGRCWESMHDALGRWLSLRERENGRAYRE